MIGPHEGKELELMLSGEKHLAAFGDIIPVDGEIHELIIPEKKFKPYVDSGEIIRYTEDHQTQNNQTMRYVCFTTPPEIWRAHAYIFIRKRLYSKEVDYTDSIDRLIGYLLGYHADDIEDFLNQFATF